MNKRILKSVFASLSLALLVGATPALAADAKLTVDSTVGALLDNAAAKAVLEKQIPAVIANPMLQQAREMPLRGIAQFEPVLTEDKLKAINAELAKVK